jgi:hypothetical protein
MYLEYKVMNCPESTRRSFLAALAAGGAAPFVRAAASRPPNLIFILVE